MEFYGTEAISSVAVATEAWEDNTKIPEPPDQQGALLIGTNHDEDRCSCRVYQRFSPLKTWNLLLDPTGWSSHHPTSVGVPPGSKVERAHR